MPRLPITRATARTVWMGGREYLYFGGCNYLGLAHDRRVLEAARRALGEFGISAAAARETTGNTVVHEALEGAAAAFVGAPAAVLTLDGYTANAAAARALAADYEVALHDARAHESLREAIGGSGMRAVAYEHRNAASAAERIAAHAGARVAVFTDGVFAADGAVAPLPELLAALPADAALVVDDCHGVGVMGEHGRGTLSHFGSAGAAGGAAWDPRVVLTGTFAKAVGCHGGFVAGGRGVVAQVRARAGAYGGTTPVPAAIAAAAAEALRIVEAEPERLARLRANAAVVRAGLRGLGLEVMETPAPVFAFVLEPAERMERVHRGLLEDGVLAPLLSYPGGPAGAYFRLAVTSEHTRADVERLIGALGAHL